MAVDVALKREGRRKRTKLLLLGAIALASLFALSNAFRNDLTRPDADRIAAARLAEYAERERIDIRRFPPPLVTSEPRYEWIFDYTSTGQPRHLVRIMVSRSGRIELSRMIE